MTVPSVVRLRNYRDYKPPVDEPVEIRLVRTDWSAPQGKVFVAVVLGVEDADGADPLPVVAMLRALVINGVPVVPDTTPIEATR